MMKTTFSVALFVLVVAGFYLLHGSFHLIFKSRSSLPSLDCVSEVRLPPTYAGALVDAHFTVRSNGDADLILEDFRSSCDCARLEVLQENRYRVVHRIGLKPGSFAVFRLRIAAASVGGKSQSVTVKFRTNMPSRSEVALDVVISYVTTKVFALPDEIEMAADVSIGKESRLIDVIGDHRETATITRAVVQGHGAFRAELLPPSRAAGKHATDEKTKLLGQVQVAATAGDQLGNRANLSIVLSDGRSLLVPLTRTVSRKLVFDPPCLALPRMVSGKA